MTCVAVRQLRKRRKDPLLVLGIDPRTCVADLDTNPFTVRSDPVHSDVHAPLQNELYGVAEEVYQDLLDARGIYHDPLGNIGVDLESQRDVLASGRFSKRRY